MASPGQTLSAFAGLLRPVNLLLIAVIQYIVQHAVIRAHGTGPFITSNELILIIVMTTTAAAAGYVINDIHDVRPDRINKPGKNRIGVALSLRQAWVAYWLLTIIGAATCLMLIPAFSWMAPAIFSLSTIGLWWYSSNLKKLPVIGNVMVSFFCAMVVYVLWIPQTHTNDDSRLLTAFNLVLAYTIFSFLITMIREIFKDIDDMEGDQTAGARTIPIKWGLKRTTRLLQTLILFLVAGIVAWHACFHRAFVWYDYVYIAGLVVVPLIVIAVMLHSPIRKPAPPFSTIIKVIIVCGTLYLIIL